MPPVPRQPSHGGGAYADPWHPFAATSKRIAAILAALGHHVEISELVADRVADLRGWGTSHG